MPTVYPISAAHNHDAVYAAATHDHDSDYLGISAKAADSDLLDAHDTAYFATADHDHDAAYLGLTAQAADSHKVDGAHASATPTASTVPIADAGGKLAVGWMPTIAGIIEMYGGATAPTGYLLCNGASYVRADYAALFTAISTTFGYADATHFNVPDMRGVYPKGAGTTARAAGKDASGNYYAATLGAYDTDKTQGHYHAVTDSFARTPGEIFQGTTSGNAWVVSYGAAGDLAAKGLLTDGTNGTPRIGLTTEPQNVGVTFIIKT